MKLLQIALDDFDPDKHNLPVAVEDIPGQSLVIVETVEGETGVWRFDPRNDFSPSGVVLGDCHAGDHLRVYVKFIPDTTPEILVIEKVT